MPDGAIPVLAEQSFMHRIVPEASKKVPAKQATVERGGQRNI